MIVTKKMAEQYILKRGCWLIHEKPDGDYSMSYESVNWKEGMEVFETSEECEAEIARRLNAKMTPGDCPRCISKRVVEARLDIGQLEVLQGKFNSLYRCTRCLTLWYPAGDGVQFLAYDKSIADYVLDWNSRDLRPSQSLRKTLNDNISSDKKEEVYLRSVTLKNGDVHPCAILLLKKFPPQSHWFERKDLFFLDQLDEVKPSPHAYSFAISKKGWKNRDFIYIRDVHTKEVFRFDALVAMFMPQDLAGREFVLAGPDEEQSGTIVTTISERNDRGGSEYWYFKPPAAPVYIWGDLG